jgi:hypothetical protein
MARQVSWGPPPEYGMPTGPKLTDVEITQARNLGVEYIPILKCRTNLYVWHGNQGDQCLDWPVADFPLTPPAIR